MKSETWASIGKTTRIIQSHAACIASVGILSGRLLQSSCIIPWVFKVHMGAYRYRDGHSTNCATPIATKYFLTFLSLTRFQPTMCEAMT